MYCSRKNVASRGVEGGQLCDVFWHNGATVVVVMDFFGALVFIAAASIIGKGAKGSIGTLSGIECVVEFVIPRVENS